MDLTWLSCTNWTVGHLVQLEQFLILNHWFYGYFYLIIRIHDLVIRYNKKRLKEKGTNSKKYVYIYLHALVPLNNQLQYNGNTIEQTNNGLHTMSFLVFFPPILISLLQSQLKFCKLCCFNYDDWHQKKMELNMNTARRKHSVITPIILNFSVTLFSWQDTLVMSEKFIQTTLPFMAYKSRRRWLGILIIPYK